MPDPLPPEVLDHLALALVPGLGPKLTAALLARFGSPAAARRATAADLRRVPMIGDKLAASFAEALRTADVAEEVRRLERFGVRPVPVGLPGYPPHLAATPDPPPLLYVRGGILPADANAIGIVGSRSCTPYGKKVAAKLAADLARAGWVTVSGLARGIDGAAHRGALDAGGRTIAVLAGGLSKIYPPEHADLADEVAARGALVSETPLTVPPQPGMFPARNRIISGLSRAVVVVEANVKSGALITVDHALEQGREVFAVPGPVDSPASAGCLELIRKGARLARGADDILDDLRGVAPFQEPGSRGPESGKTTARTPDLPGLNGDPLPPDPVPTVPDMPPDQRRVWDALGTARHADELARELGTSAAELAVVLLKMDMAKRVRRLPGNSYERR